MPWIKETFNVSSLRYGHSPDNVRVAKGHEDDRIYVKRGGRIHDGNKRLRDAKARGQRKIRGYRWVD